MPVILDDDILIPPSMRANRALPRRYYESTTIIEPSNASTTTIELPPHRPDVMTPPRSPIIIHREEMTRIVPGRREAEFSDDACSCCSGDFEYEAEGGRRGGRRYYAEGSINMPSMDTRRLRSLSVGHPLRDIAAVEGAHRLAEHEYDKGYHRGRRDSKFDASEGEYFMEDGSRRNYYLADVHRGPHILPGHDHYDAPGYNESAKHHRRAKRLAQAGLTVAALGAAKELHDHRRGRPRSRSLSRSRSRSPHHHGGRKLAAGALGATAAAGIAAHKLREHRRHSRSRSAHSHHSDSDGEHHRKAKIAAGTAAAIGGAAALAHHMRKRRESQVASRSHSRSSSRERRHSHTGRHIAAAALGGTAAGLAHHHYKHHRNSHGDRPRPIMRRSHSDSSFRRHHSPSPHKHSKLKQGAALAAAAVVAKEALDHYRARSRSRSKSRGNSRERHHHHPHHSRHGSRSPSPHHGGIGQRIAQTVAGALGDGRNRLAGHPGTRSRGNSISEDSRRHGGGMQVPTTDRHRHMYASPGGPYPSSSFDYGSDYAEALSSSGSDSDSDIDKGDGHGRPHRTGTRSRSNSLGDKVVEGIKSIVSAIEDKREVKRDENTERRRLGYGLDPEHIAHKLGQTLGGHDKR